jgi:hypothetical protein
MIHDICIFKHAYTSDAGELHSSWNMVTDFHANNYTVIEIPKKIE